MHIAARSALLASCIAMAVQALPVTYSVVDVDGGSAANGASDQPATIYQTVTKSTDAEEPEATTVSVSITIVETKHASLTSTDVSSSLSSPASSSTSSPSSSLKASAQASSSAPVPSATAANTQDASSVLQSASSTFSTRPTSNSAFSAKPTITQPPSAESASYGSQTASSEECEAPIVTVTADVTDAEETVTATKGETVVLLSTTTVVPTASSTSYYDDGMWHTRYAVKPSASPEAEKPASQEDDAAPTFDKSPKFNEKKQTYADQGIATNTTSQTSEGTHHARREVDAVAPTPTAPTTPSGRTAEGSGASLMFIQPLFARATGLAARAVPTGGVASPSDVLSADVVPDTVQFARRAPTYSVVSWNETLQG